MDIGAYYQQIDIFKNIDFDYTNHSYKISGKNALSVTETLKSFVRKFDSVYWAEKKSLELNVSPAEILKKWETNSKISKIKGTLIHSYIEAIFKNDEFIYPEDFIINEFGFDPVQDAFNTIIPQVDKFMTDITDKMYSVATEFIIGDMDALICGTVDQIFYNKKSDKLEIWDWKTNKEMKTISRYFHLPPLIHIPDTELDRYSLQLSLYKEILEKNTKIEFGNSYLAWFNENNNSYQIFKANDYKKEAKLILNIKG